MQYFPYIIMQQRTWTIMIYIVADNNLEEDTLLNIDEMERARPGE